MKAKNDDDVVWYDADEGMSKLKWVTSNGVGKAKLSLDKLEDSGFELYNDDFRHPLLEKVARSPLLKALHGDDE